MSESIENSWYCLRAKPKCEHLAAAHLSRIEGVSVFCPRIRFERATRSGTKWFVEALFPGYLFASFDLETQYRHVNGTPNVSGIVRFGDLYPEIESAFIEQLRDEFPPEEKEVRIVENKISEGDEVEVVTGPMAGIQSVVTHYFPAQERVTILLEWLGQEREAEVSLSAIRKSGEVRSFE